MNLLAISFVVFTFIGTVKEFAVKQLYANDSKNELKQQIND